MTKAQLQAKIDRMEAQIAQQSAKIEAQAKEIAALKAAQALEDMPAPTTRLGWDSKREAARRGGFKALQNVIDWAARNYAHIDAETDADRAATGLGSMLNMVLHSGDHILLCAAVALQEENWHPEARAVYEMYKRNQEKLAQG